jgi:hypothetical protein
MKSRHTPHRARVSAGACDSTTVQRSIVVREVLAMCLAPNKKVCAVSERRTPRPGEPHSNQVSIFHVASLTKVRSISAVSRAVFTGLCFSGDSKYLVGFAAEPDFQVVVWQWDKESVFAVATVNVAVTRVCSNPGQAFQVPPTLCAPTLMGLSDRGSIVRFRCPSL